MTIAEARPNADLQFVSPETAEERELLESERVDLPGTAVYGSAVTYSAWFRPEGRESLKAYPTYQVNYAYIAPNGAPRSTIAVTIDYGRPYHGTEAVRPDGQPQTVWLDCPDTGPEGVSEEDIFTAVLSLHAIQVALSRDRVE